jgi:hypothetical protein
MYFKNNLLASQLLFTPDFRTLIPFHQISFIDGGLRVFIHSELFCCEHVNALVFRRFYYLLLFVAYSHFRSDLSAALGCPTGFVSPQANPGVYLKAINLEQRVVVNIKKHQFSWRLL